ncbi:MAG: hypothetical protein AAFR79_16050 [Pseudomonadota bacterium]
MRTAAVFALTALVASPVPAQQTAPGTLPDVVAEQTTVGALYAAGYEFRDDLQTTPATDAATVRFTFIMHQPGNQALPMYMCRMLVGPGEDDAEDPLVVLNKCELIR